jgi:hypothetical protein
LLKLLPLETFSSPTKFSRTEYFLSIQIYHTFFSPHVFSFPTGRKRKKSPVGTQRRVSREKRTNGVEEQETISKTVII